MFHPAKGKAALKITRNAATAGQGEGAGPAGRAVLLMLFLSRRTFKEDILRAQHSSRPCPLSFLTPCGFHFMQTLWLAQRDLGFRRQPVPPPDKHGSPRTTSTSVRSRICVRAAPIFPLPTVLPNSCVGKGSSVHAWPSGSRHLGLQASPALKWVHCPWARGTFLSTGESLRPFLPTEEAAGTLGTQ